MQDRSELFRIFSFTEKEIKEEMNKNPQPHFENVRTNLVKQRVILLALTEHAHLAKDSLKYSPTILEKNIHAKVAEQLNTSLENIREACEKDYQETLDKIRLLETSYNTEIEKIFFALKSIERALQDYVYDILIVKKTKMLNALKNAANDYRTYFLKKGTTHWESQFKTFIRIFSPIASIKSSIYPYELKFKEFNASEITFKELEKISNDVLHSTLKDKVALKFLDKHLNPLIDNYFSRVDSNKLIKFVSEDKALTLIRHNDGFEPHFYNIHKDLLACSEKYKDSLQTLYADLNNKWLQQIETLENIQRNTLADLEDSAQASYNAVHHRLKALKKTLILAARTHNTVSNHLKPIFKCRDSIFELDAKPVQTKYLIEELNQANVVYQTFLSNFQNIKPQLESLENDVTQAVKSYAGPDFYKLQARLSNFSRAAALITTNAELLQSDLKEANFICEQIEICAIVLKIIREFQHTLGKLEANFAQISEFEMTANRIQQKAKVFLEHSLIDEKLEMEAIQTFKKTAVCWKLCKEAYDKLQSLQMDIKAHEKTLKNFSPSLLLQSCQTKINAVNKQMEDMLKAKGTASARICSINNTQETLAANREIIKEKFGTIDYGNQIKSLILLTILNNLPQFKASGWGGGKSFTHNGTTYQVAEGVYDILTKVISSPHPQDWLNAVQQTARQRLALYSAANPCQLSSLRYSLFGLRNQKVEHFYKTISKYANMHENTLDNLSREFKKIRL